MMNRFAEIVTDESRYKYFHKKLHLNLNLNFANFFRFFFAEHLGTTSSGNKISK